MRPAVFVLRYGIISCGVPVAALTDLVYLTLGKNWPMFFSLQHVEQLLVTMLTIAPTVGAAAGCAWLRLRPIATSVETAV